MTSAQLTAIIDEYAEATTQQPPDRSRLAAATRDLLMAVCDTAAVQSATTVVLLIERQELLQREIQALNVRMDEWDGSRSRTVGE
jgi:hypothetical protein